MAALAPTRALAFVQEITIETQLAHLPIITVQLNPPYRDAINFLEVQFGYISSTTGAGALVSPVYSGVLLKPEVALGQDVTITLNAQGVSGFSATRQAGGRTFNNVTRLQMITAVAEGRVAERVPLEGESFAPEGRAKEIVQVAKNLRSGRNRRALMRFDPDRFGIGDLELAENALLAAKKSKAVARNKRLQALVDSKLGSTRAARIEAIRNNTKTSQGPATRKVKVNADAVLKEKDSAAYKALLKEPQLGRSQGGDTDWLFIWKLVRECQCFMLWDVDREGTGKEEDRNVLNIFPRDTALVGKSKRTFRLYDYPRGAIGPAAGVFPILSASSPAMYIYLPGSSRGLHMADKNSETRATDKLLVGDKESGVARTGEGGSTPLDNSTYPSTDPNTGDGAKKFPGSPVDGQAFNQAKNEYAQKTFGMGINLTIESLADPTIFPGDVIQVRGLGARIDDNKFAVFKQTFTLGSSGSSMSVECVSNTGNLSNQVKGVGPKGKADKPGDEAPENTSTTKVEATNI
jgi:hypothetical protein